MKIKDMCKKLKNVYSVSLCKGGLVGGLLYVKETEMVYCTNKLTVAENIRRLHLPYGEMQKVEKKPWGTVLVTMKGGEGYRFLVFARKRFLESVSEQLHDVTTGLT